MLGGKVLPGDENQDWRDEGFGERPVLTPWGDPFLPELEDGVVGDVA